VATGAAVTAGGCDELAAVELATTPLDVPVFSSNILFTLYFNDLDKKLYSP